MFLRLRGELRWVSRSLRGKGDGLGSIGFAWGTSERSALRCVDFISFLLAMDRLGDFGSYL